MESTGRFFLPLYHFLLANDIQAFVINPKILHRFFQFLSANNPSKSDTKDAKLLALFAQTNPQFLNPLPPDHHLRNLSRLIQKLKKELSEAKTQIKYALSVLFPEVEKHLNIFSFSFLNILLKYPGASYLKKASTDDIASIINSTSKARKPSFSPQEIINLAKKSIGIHNPYLSQTLIFYIEKILFLEPRIQKLENMLLEEIDHDQNQQIKLISSIRGISPKLAVHFIAEVKDVNRFSNAKKLIKYAGTDPVIKQSGKFRINMSISKQGSPWLRNILFQMAVGVVTWNSYFREYFLRKKKEFKSYKKAMVAVMNKLIRVIYGLCKKGSYFNPVLSFNSKNFISICEGSHA
jgi:transposase